MFAIFKIKNQQFIAQEGDIIRSNLKLGNVNDVLSFNSIQYSENSEAKVVELQILRSELGEKVTSIKKRRRKSSSRKYGARNFITVMRVIKINK